MSVYACSGVNTIGYIIPTIRNFLSVNACGGVNTIGYIIPTIRNLK
jgi:hypothetical protein